MSTYRICSLGDGMGFKVQVTDAAGGLRVVGIFPDEAIAKVWVAADKAGGELDAESVAS